MRDEAEASAAPAKAGTPGSIDAQVIIIGAGFSGICLGARLKEKGGRSFIILEKADDVGGTWRDNQYPGCACDIPSHLYSLSFEPKTDWSRFYPPQQEIWDYLRHVVEKRGLKPHIRFGAEFERAEWDEEGMRWRIFLTDGRELRARHLVSGVGALHVPSIPKLKGAENFKGPAFHSARWDHSVDLAGKNVAVVGTGASAIQIVPNIADKTNQLYVFQRTAPWVLPKVDRPIRGWEQWLIKNVPGWRALIRRMIYWGHEVRALALFKFDWLMEVGERRGLKLIEEQIPDPEMRAKVTPHYRLGCKRVLLANDWYPTLMRDDVELVTEAIDEVREHAIVTADGEEREIDVLVYGTGFDVTESLLRMDVTGRGGEKLPEVWAGGARGFLGVTVPRFPNFYLMLGPNTGLGHNSVVLMIEAQTEYILSCLDQMDEKGLAAIDAKPEALAVFVDEMESKLSHSVWLEGGCKSWYLDRHGNNTTVWPGFVSAYRGRTHHASLDDYRLTEAAET